MLWIRFLDRVSDPSARTYRETVVGPVSYAYVTCDLGVPELIAQAVGVEDSEVIATLRNGRWIRTGTEETFEEVRFKVSVR